MKHRAWLFTFSILLATLVNVPFSSVFAQQRVSSLADYCVDEQGNALGYYLADGGKKCGRAPYCAGKTLEEVGPMDYASVKECWDGRCSFGMCTGQVPLCCYEVERTGDGNYCTWPERGYCLPSQCEKIPQDQRDKCIGSNFVSFSDCNCGSAIKTWCKQDCGTKSDGSDIPYIPLEVRLGLAVPTNTPSPTQAPNCLQKAKAGDYDCNDAVNSVDFDAWKTDFLQNKTTLAFFEYWRRAAFSQ